MTLLEKQWLFAGTLLPLLIQKAKALGFEVTLGEAWRPEITAHYYASIGKGISHSLHISRLAIDLNLYRNHLWLEGTEDHRPLGEYWESLSTEFYKCCWGGHFSKPDGCHYSIELEGRA